jgi:hypothetical protein
MSNEKEKIARLKLMVLIKFTVSKLKIDDEVNEKISNIYYKKTKKTFYGLISSGNIVLL